MSRYLLLLCRNGEDDLGDPPPQFVEAIANMTQRWFADGVLFDTGGLGSIRAGMRADSDADPLVSDADPLVTGPLRTSCQFSGFAIIDVESSAQAHACAVESLHVHQQFWPGWRGACEIREIID